MAGPEAGTGLSKPGPIFYRRAEVQPFDTLGANGGWGAALILTPG